MGNVLYLVFSFIRTLKWAAFNLPIVVGRIISEVGSYYKNKWQTWKQEPILTLIAKSTVLVVERHT